MNKKTEDNDNGNSFEYRLREVSDEEIISILSYRDHFQPSAVKAAIKEALKRGIINSVDDLNDPKFQPQELPARSLFPLATSEAQNIGVFKSLCRIFYGFGLLPIIYAILNISKNPFNAIAAFLAGAIIIFIANRLEKTMKPFFANMILAINVPAIGFAIYTLTLSGNPTTMDGVAISIVILVLLYTTFYANKLTSHFNKNMEENEE